MKKGFTLIEMVVTLGIMVVLISIIFPNVTPLNKAANIDKFTNETATLFRESYENANKKVEYSLWHIEIDNYYSGSNDKLTIKLMKDDQIIDWIETGSFTIQGSMPSMRDLSDGIYQIHFDSTGSLMYKKDSGEEKLLNELELRIYEKEDTSNYRTIKIKSLPPGTVITGGI